LFKEIRIDDLLFNPFTKIDTQWALLTAGTKERRFNTMTASWAGFGTFWSKPVITTYIRKSRYTWKFFNENALFTVSFYDENHRRALELCGQLHGNECDKVKEANLTPYFTDGTAAFEEASLIFICRKLFHTDIEKEGVDAIDVFDSVYDQPDYHRIYVGEVLRVLAKK